MTHNLSRTSCGRGRKEKAMVQKVGELSWFERMTKEFENDPEYLREYIMLCSSQIKDQETKIAALEQRFDALSSKFAALVEENATLRKRLDESCRFTVDPDSEFAKDSMELKEGE